MIFANALGGTRRAAAALLIAFGLLTLPASGALAAPAVQLDSPPVASEAPVSAQDEPTLTADGEEAAEAEATAPAAPRMKPTEGKGMPIPDGIGLQKQYSPIGDYAHWIHNAVLLPIIAVISLFVLGLLLWVIARYNRRSNPIASKTSHNTLIEVIWTLLPVLILVGIAVPSIDLLAEQYEPAPEEAITVKAIGNQWYWTYEYPDNGGIEYTSYMLNLPDYPEINSGIRYVGEDPSDGPSHFEVDNRLVLPVGEPIRMQVTASDVIHSFAIPSLWFKIDAVPGRINEMVLTIKEPGVYYGQCSELCGPKHAFMPIAIEALPRPQFEAWVRSQGGMTKAEAKAAAAAEARAAAAASAAADEAETETAATAEDGAAADAEMVATAPDAPGD